MSKCINIMESEIQLLYTDSCYCN